MLVAGAEQPDKSGMKGERYAQRPKEAWLHKVTLESLWAAEGKWRPAKSRLQVGRSMHLVVVQGPPVSSCDGEEWRPLSCRGCRPCFPVSCVFFGFLSRLSSSF